MMDSFLSERLSSMPLDTYLGVECWVVREVCV